MSGAVWGAVAEAALKIGDSWMNSSAQHKANRTNIKLQREQQQWEEMMSNTSVQRRVKDITAAGGNPALAFESGASASTPSISPARVDSEYQQRGDIDITSKMLAATQMQNVNASTELTTQKARQEKEVADWMTGKSNVPGASNEFAKRSFENIKRDFDASTAKAKADLTAAQLKQFEEASASVIQIAQQQAAKGKIDLEQIKSVIETFGLGAQQKASILAAIGKLILQATKD